MSYFTRFAHLLNGDPDQPRDELGRWTSTGSGGSGSVEVSRQAQAQIDTMNVTAFAKVTGASPVELTEKFQRGTGVDLRIDNIGVSFRNHTFVEWTIMKDGRKIGTISRSWSPDGTTVAHETIMISPRHQGTGLGRALIGNMFAHYRESGVKLVTVLASPDLGD